MSNTTATSQDLLSKPCSNPRITDWAASLPTAYEKYGKPADVMGMTSPFEWCFIQSYAEACFSGKGRLVDLGCWFGATSIALASGLRSNRRTEVRPIIEAYDLFQWDEWMVPIAGKMGLQHDLKPGDCFLETVRQRTADYALEIDFRKENLAIYRSAPEPIEFLFIDANKSWTIAENIMRTFFPKLIPGESVVVQQDYAWFYSNMATNIMSMWMLRDSFRWLHHVPKSCSVAFEMTGELPDSLDLKIDQFSIDEIDEAYVEPMERLEAPYDGFVRISKFLYLLQRGFSDQARQELEILIAEKVRIHERQLPRIVAELRRFTADPAAAELGEQLRLLVK